MLKTVIIGIGYFSVRPYCCRGDQKVAVPERGDEYSFTQPRLQQGFPTAGPRGEIAFTSRTSSLEKALSREMPTLPSQHAFPTFWQPAGAPIKAIPRITGASDIFGFPAVAPYAAWLICMPNQLAMVSRPH